MLKKIFCTTLLFVLIFSLTCCANNNNQSFNSADNKNPNKVITLVLADNQPATYPTSLGDKEFARLVKERTNGRIQIDVVTDGELGAENDVVTQIQMGTIDFARVSSSSLTNFDPKLNVLALPFLFRDEQQMWDVLDGPIGKDILNNLSSSDIVGLAFYDSGARSFYNNKKEITSPSDLKGLRIRVQSSDLMESLATSLGSIAVPLDMTKVTQALALGQIDGAENNPPSYVSSGQYLIAKYYTLDEHSRIPDTVIASKIAMDKLSNEDQDIIKKAAADSVQVQKSEWNKYQTNCLNKLKAAGCKVTQLDDASKQQFIDAVQPVYDKFGAKYQDIINDIRNTK
jgi:tripartite ATP-independent transporter DctP family solute receptor